MRINQALKLSLGFCSGAVLALAGAGPAMAANGTCGPLTQMTTVSLGINPGTQSLITDVMKRHGFDKKYNLNVDVKNFLNPPAAATAVTQKVVDLGYGGITTMAIARAQGTDVVFYGPFMTTPQDGLFVPKDSPVQTLSDLRGKKIGSFSGTASATTAILSAIAAKSYDMPQLSKLADIVVAPAPALFGLLDKGNVDAVLTVDTDSVRADLTGKYRRILDLAKDYTKAYGTNPMFVGLVSTDSFMKDNCSTIKAFSRAQADAVEYAKTHDSVWSDYAKAIDMNEPGAAKALQDLGTVFTTEWGDEQIASVTDLLNQMIPILGAKNFISKVPDGLFVKGYWVD